jgi:DNA mismatch repair protein MutS2
MNGVMPKFNTERRLDIRAGRHPLLDPKTVVPTNIYLGDAFDLLIITGPNTGGKTVALKTVGLFTLMGQAGLHIPAEQGSELAVFKEVFADIGDEQSIEQNLSTFSAHMANIVQILKYADTESLCLFDELGAGTDPTEGAALAISVLNFLHNMTTRTMATTHYSELKIYALQTPGVENASCEFDVETLAPTYRLLIGIPGKSNAFAISKKLGLPDYIIDDAKKRINEEDESFEDVIAKLQNNRVTIEKEREEIETCRKEIVRLKHDLEDKEKKLSEQHDKVLESAKAEAREILRDAKDTADRTIRSINKIAQDSNVSRELEEQRGKIRGKLDAVEKSMPAKKKAAPKKKVEAETLHLGDTVRVNSMNMTGTVTSLPNKAGELTVQMGIMNTRVNVNDLELIVSNDVTGPGYEKKNGSFGGGRRQNNRNGSGNIGMSKSMSVSPEVNLIGMTTDEAIPAMDKYLDDAYLAHLEEVRIIHGRGTGALRNAVHRELRRLKYVKSFRDGDFDEGGNGATVVTFK